jgi:hypothetical protein
VPLIHQLRLQYANLERARNLVQYRRDLRAQKAYDDGLTGSTLRDFWDAKLCCTLQQTGLLNDDTDIALAMSTDGVELFRKGKKHEVWPVVLQCYNLAPEVRFQEDNIICNGVIPGPHKPKDIDSFLYPTVRDLKMLHNGVTTYNAANKSDFILRAHVVTVTADMPARDMLMGLSGYNSRHYCNYCTVRGCVGYQSTSTHNISSTNPNCNNNAVDCDGQDQDPGSDADSMDIDNESSDVHASAANTSCSKLRKGNHVYCPLEPPKDVPHNPDWRDYNPRDLQLRSHSGDMTTAEYFRRDGCDDLSPVQLKEITDATGIKAWSTLRDLPSIRWPWYVTWFLISLPAYPLRRKLTLISDDLRSFPIDSMHLFYLNIVPNMRDHWQGNFFPWEKQPGAFGTAQQTKVKPSGEPYCIRVDNWMHINNDISLMVHPTAFGDRIRGIADFRKANEWKTWAQVISPILLKGRLPDPFYSEWIKLVYAMTLATDYSVSQEDIQLVRESMISFVNHYHDLYYRYQNNRLPACRAVFHALLHVADCMEWVGPMWSYSQWVVERMFSLWTPKVKQRATASRNLSLAMLRSSWVSNLGYSANLLSPSIAHRLDWDHTLVPLMEDDERMTQLSRISTLLGKIRQSPAHTDGDDVERKPRYRQAEDHQSTLHHSIGSPMRLTVIQLLKLKEYLDSLELRFPSTVDFQQEINHGVPSNRGRPSLQRKKADALTNITVKIWQKCLLNDPNAPQGLYRAYIRSAVYEKAGARDSTYIRYEIIQDSTDSHGLPVSHTVGKFGRVHFFFEYECFRHTTQTSCSLLLAWVEEIPVVAEVSAAGTLYRVRHLRTATQTNTVDLHYPINIDSISCLAGMVSTTGGGGKQASYMIEKDSCFL